jgi:hypothetical protein
MQARHFLIGLTPLFLGVLAVVGGLWSLLAFLCWLHPTAVVRVLLACVTGAALVAGFGWYCIAAWAWHWGRGEFVSTTRPLILFGVAWLLCLCAAFVSADSVRDDKPTPDTHSPSASKVFDRGPCKYLSDLTEFDKRDGLWPFAKNGLLGDGGKTIIVNGYSAAKGLGMHPPDNGEVFVKFRLHKEAAVFKTRAAINDTAGRPGGAAHFEVIGDGKPLWKSGALSARGETQECQVDVTGIDVLELRVRAAGPCQDLHAVWIDPRVLRNADTPDTPPSLEVFTKGPRAFLSDLAEFDVKLGPIPFAKKGAFDSKTPIKVEGTPSPNGLGMHPPPSGYAAAKYRLGKQAVRFRAKGALNDGSSFTIGSCFFEVLGDGRSLWKSKTISKEKQVQECDIDVTGVEVLELRVVDPDIVNTGIWAVWFEPRVLQSSDADE